MSDKVYKFLGVDEITYESNEPDMFDGHKKLIIYGPLDCLSALPYIEKVQNVIQRVFFNDEETAIESCFRPCAKCMPDEYGIGNFYETIFRRSVFI